jgi:sugar O-acyltransferase (sialic acid O-acetyltransferase NeuD family)
MHVVIYGSRPDGHAKVCLETLELLGWTCAGCLDDVAAAGATPLRGLEILGGRDALAGLRERGVEGVVLGFGLGSGRRALVEPIRRAGLALPPLVHPGAHVAASARIGDAAQVMCGAVVGGDCVVGEAALVNAGAVLEHDVLVGPGATIGPGAVLAGRASVEADATLGANASVPPDGLVAEGATVPAGTVAR